MIQKPTKGLSGSIKSLMTNRRYQPPLRVESKLGRAVHAQSLLPAAVAYLNRSVSMKTLCLLILLGACVAVVGCSHSTKPSQLFALSEGRFTVEIVVPPDSATDIAAKADLCVSRAGLDWGHPTEVVWQGRPVDRYVVFYGTPGSDLGYRSVAVTTNGDAWILSRK